MVTKASWLERVAAALRLHAPTCIPGLFMVLFLAVGLLLSLFNRASYHSPSDQDLLTGEWTAAYQREFEANLALYEPALHSWTALSYSLFQEAQPGVLIGHDGWLFSDEEFIFYPSGHTEIEAKLELIEEIRDRLEARGIQLVIALVPAKARVYTEQLGRYTLPSYVPLRSQYFREQARARGLLAPDLYEELHEARHEASIFLRTDTHWSPFGARVAAEHLARVVQDELKLTRLNEAQYETVHNGTRTYKGDLMGFIPLGPYQKQLGPRPDSLQLVQTEPRSQGNAGLFDEVDIPITLVGTSYSADERWNFAGALQVALGAEVLNVAEQGQGPFQPMLRYLASDTFEETPPELIIWEMPERYLPVPINPGTGALEPSEPGQKGVAGP